nr:oxysterol-binding protein 2 [Oryctolagus cuniculus]XP_051684624.1 oxysterol-binding protein 2 [Oryctolagus cuniculus]XP_051684625.1 oxysterol-binding protein 2 [Oryctolagus cuniculus]XP_051684626.1 oxysterol-binding protein 2 [Oryctolagus cuniculus]XP_051684627.1 oxysterol-binding protein 2 [Oryctolagus cuniculus]
MGKAAAPSRSGGCGGRSRGLSSLLTVVPCLSCHTAAPGMSAPTPGSELELQPQPVRVPEPASLAEQAWEPVSERALKMSERSERMSEPGPATGQGLELSLKVRPRSESSPCGAAPATPSRASSEQLAPAVGGAPGPKTESGLVPAIKPLPLLRPGQAKAPLGVPATATGPSASTPMGSLTLDSFKGWLLKWTNYLKGYQRRWFVLGNGLLSYYRYGSAQVWGVRGGREAADGAGRGTPKPRYPGQGTWQLVLQQEEQCLWPRAGNPDLAPPSVGTPVDRSLAGREKRRWSEGSCPGSCGTCGGCLESAADRESLPFLAGEMRSPY